VLPLTADDAWVSSIRPAFFLLGGLFAFALSCGSAAQPVDLDIRTVWLPGIPADEIRVAALYVMQSRGSVNLSDPDHGLIEGGYGDFKVRIQVSAGGSVMRLTCIHPAPWRPGTVSSAVCLDDVESAIRGEL
jgi:hypothetical protein